jgi:hypothetical protein
MITENEYLHAKKVTEQYEDQLKQSREMANKQRETDQRKRENECGEHYFIASGGKWSSQGQMTCQNCGKTIGR